MKKKYFILVIIIFGLGLLVYFFFPVTQIELNASIKKSYPSLDDAVSSNYQSYPSNRRYIPRRTIINSAYAYVNPATKSKLEIDTSIGGGYVCCELATFYLYIDREDNIFWIKDHQASPTHRYTKWFGPFKLEK